MGDPETQPLVRLVKGGLFEPLYHALEGKPVSIEFEPGSSVCVVLASQGYPEKPAKGYLIKGLDEAAKIEGVRIYHAGTGLNDQRQIVCNGGRVLGITGYSPLEGLTGLKEAQNRAYLAANIIQEQTRPFGNLVARRDIAEKAFA
jgi:phosphoribosylamine--glycine ligase